MSDENKKKSTAHAPDSRAPQMKFRITDWVAKLICLLIAFVLWFYIYQVDSPEYEQVFTSVPIELTNTAALESQRGLYVYTGYGSAVDVTLRGRKSDMSSITAEDIKVTADVSTIKDTGVQLVELNATVDGNVTIASLSSNSINVFADKKDTVTVSVVPKITSVIVESPNRLGDPYSDTEEITVTGAKSFLDTISYAQATLEVGRISATQTMITKLTLISKNGDTVPTTYLKLSKSEVNVVIPLYTNKTVPLAVAFKYGFYNTKNADIAISPATVELTGDPELLRDIDSLTVTTIDEKQITDDEVRYVTIPLPDGVEAVSGATTAMVEIKHKNTITRMFMVTNIIVTGAEALDYELPVKRLIVTLRGPAEAVRALKSSDLSVVVDLSSYSPESSGIVSEPVVVQISGSPEGVYEIGTYTVQVSLGGDS